MEYKTVITGEVIGLTRTIQYSSRESILKAIVDTCQQLNDWELAVETFQGKCFQVLLERPETTARVALILRCAVKALSQSPKDGDVKLDAGLSIGIGTIEYYGDSISTSDGLVFRLSGRGLDAMKKRRRLSIPTPWEDFNQEITVCTNFADSVVTSWSAAQARLMKKYLASPSLSNKELAQLMGESQQNLSKKLKCVQAKNIDLYLDFFENGVRKLTSDT